MCDICNTPIRVINVGCNTVTACMCEHQIHIDTDRTISSMQGEHRRRMEELWKQGGDGHPVLVGDS